MYEYLYVHHVKSKETKNVRNCSLNEQAHLLSHIDININKKCS